MRVVVIGDVGVVDGMMHIGDEAMFDALVEALRARGATSIVGISNARRRPPSATASRRSAGSGSPARAPRWRPDSTGCCAAPRASASLPADDPAWTVIDAVVGRGCGGRRRRWQPGLDLADARLRARRPRRDRRTRRPAARRDRPDARPSARSGRPRTRRRRLLRSARLVGVREHASAELARRLGVGRDRLAANRDDATFLGAADDARSPVGAPATARHDPREPVACTSAGSRALPAVAGLAASLDRLADRSRASRRLPSPLRIARPATASRATRCCTTRSALA